MRFVTRRALKHLFWLSVFIVALIFVCWLVMIRMPSKSFRGPLPPLTNDQVALRDALKRDVTVLASEIGERNVFNPAKLKAAAEYIANAFASAGYEVWRQAYMVSSERCENLYVEIKGRRVPDEIVVVGAHYDSVSGSPGANDNGSGVAALLALARGWAGRTPERTLRFVAFVNEEPPFFQTEQMGSLVYAKECRTRGERIVAMLSLECIGYYSDTPGSQKYPPPVGLFYPSRGNFIGFVGNVSNRKLVCRCVRVFRAGGQFPSEGGALPEFLPGINWSDHWSFWQVGYPAVMVTDTAPFRYPHYHGAEDTPDKLDFDKLARVVSGLRHVIDELANQ